ncbi:MAG: hypothetical protein WBQ10_11030 [Terriglobales bacterium]
MNFRFNILDSKARVNENYKIVLGLLSGLCLLTFTAPSMHSQDKNAQGAVQVHLVVTNEAQRGDEVPTLQQGDVKVKQGNNFLTVNQLIPAKGDNAALQLFVLIDDTLGTAIGSNLNDIRDFINAQPVTTVIAVGYMSNAAVQVAQNFTADHALAAKALRLPRGSLSTMDSPYLSLISLVKGWPQQNVRREVLMVSDGIDRLRGEQPGRSTTQPMTPRSGRTPGSSRLGPDYGPVYHSMPIMSPDVNSASEISQRYNVIVYSLYAVGVGRAARSSWDLQIGLSGLTKIADETGGDCFSLGTSSLVSFKPYLDRLQKMLDNQYYVVFQAISGKKDGLQRVNLTTEVPNSEIAAADNVWVPAAK